MTDDGGMTDFSGIDGSGIDGSGPPQWERGLTTLLFAVFGVACAFVTMFAGYLELVSQPCDDGGVNCNDTVIGLGVKLGFIGPGVLWVACLLWALRLVNTARWAWWVPVVGTLALPLLFFFALSIAQSGVSA